MPGALTAVAALPRSFAVVTPRPDRDSFTIADLADEFAVTARALRFYEGEGLIAPERRGRARVYSHRDRARLAWILRGKRMGFSLAAIREMIDLYDLGDGRRHQRAVAIERCRERIALLEARRRDIDAAVAELTEFVAVLEAGRDSDEG